MHHVVVEQEVKTLRPSKGLPIFSSNICRSLAEEVFLRPLADKFGRLLLQLLARYSSWLRLGTSQAEATAESSEPLVSLCPCDTDEVLPPLHSPHSFETDIIFSFPSSGNACL